MNSFGIKSCLTDDFSSINQTRKPNVYNKSQTKKHAVYTQTESRKPWANPNATSAVPAKKFRVSLNHKPLDSKVSRKAPFGGRPLSSASCECPKVVNGKVAMPHYSSLDDPHLNDYFARKLGIKPKLSDGNSLKKALKKEKPKACSMVYNIMVRTGDKKNAQTNAKVYLQIRGTFGKLKQQHLIKKAEENDDPSKSFVFKQGSTETFTLRSPDIGDLIAADIEHDGVDRKQSWYLEEIIVKNQKTKETWFLPCQNWLSLYEGDCQVKRTLKPVKGNERPDRVVYEIQVITGNVRGAGTDAHVYLTMFGDMEPTRRVQLVNRNINTFERDQTDIFKIKVKYLGRISKIQVEHDNAGFAPGWFLDKVIITNTSNVKENFYFVCNQWFSKDDGDQQISRLLLGTTSLDNLQISHKYNICTYTGDVRGAGTDADVYITLFSKGGSTNEIKLNNSKNNFERDKLDKFVVECPIIGPLSRVRIRHDNSGLAPGWFLNKVVVKDGENHEYEFLCQRWLSMKEDDGQISRDLMLLDPENENVIPGILYNVHITTGDIRGASTSAKVYMILYGGKKGNISSGKLWLHNGKDDNFKRDRTALFTVECCEEVSPLHHITIGHDNSGVGAGWYLEKVFFEAPTTGVEQTFFSRQWFADDEDDEKIERDLIEDMDYRKQREIMFTWSVKVHTSDIRGAGTDANVFFVLYGEKGKSDEIKLDNETNNFERGDVDNFKMNLKDVGTPYKIRVWHDNSNLYADWHLNKVIIENSVTFEKYTFFCDAWLSASDEDGGCLIEIPLEGENSLPVIPYEVNVITGDKRGAGTDANVFVNIFGERGDTGDRSLLKSSTNRNKFERKNEDKFIVKAVDLSELTSIRIGHDGKNAGAGWFLDKVVIKNPLDDQIYPFLCSRWLASDEDDGLIIREIPVGDTATLLKTTSYHVSVKTGDIRGAGTDATVYIIIYGDNGDTGKLLLKQSKNTKDKWERGRTDAFTVEAMDIGKVIKLTIGHDGSGFGSGWFLDSVNVDIPSNGQKIRFACNRWFDTNEDDGLIERTLYPSEEIELSNKVPYEVEVHTGDVSGAGTDANVFLVLYGKTKKSDEFWLRNKTDNFERRQVDKFKIDADEVGTIRKIRVGHDNKGFGAAWHLDKIIIRRLKPPVVESDDEEGLDEEDLCNYVFPCNRWFSKGEDDGQIVRELVPYDSTGTKKRANSLADTVYVLHVYTGDMKGGGTNSNVFITVYGENGDSGERAMKKSETHFDKFERNQEDIFKLETVNLGMIKKVKVRHDNSGLQSSWYLEKIQVEDTTNEKTYVFPCDRWLSKTEDDGALSRELVPVDKAEYERRKSRALLRRQSTKKSISGDVVDLEEIAEKTIYNVTVETGDVSGAGTDANVYIKVYGENDDSGKVELKTSKTNKDKFERNQVDEFIMEAVDLGKITKIRIGHDNKGGFAGWYLDNVVIDAPSMGQKWFFPAARWIDKSKDDGELEIELFPSNQKEEVYEKCVPYEIVVYTSDLSGAGTDSNVFITLYGFGGVSTDEVFLTDSKKKRKECFNRGSVDVFVRELKEIGEQVDKIRIGHDNKGFGAAWHLDKVEVRRLLKEEDNTGGGSVTFTFKCSRWFAKKEDDGQIVRELVPSNVVEETVDKHGKVVVAEHRVDALEVHDYKVHVHTGDIRKAGTDANVFITLYGENGDSGERQLMKSETNRDKFERGKEDIFTLQAADLGYLKKIMIRHDNSNLGSDWYLDRVEVNNSMDSDQKYLFVCERWLATKREDKKIKRTIYEKNYEGDRFSTCTSVGSLYNDSSLSLTSVKTNGTNKGSPTLSRKMSMRSNHCDQIFENEVKGKMKRRFSKTSVGGQSLKSLLETIPYTVRVATGDKSEHETTSNVYIVFIGTDGVSEKIPLQLVGKEKFEAGSVNTFSVESDDVGDLAKIELSHDGYRTKDSWYVKHVEVDVPTTGHKYFFPCDCWLGKDKEDGKTEKIFSVDDAKDITYKPKIPYQMTIYTGDLKNAGTDSLIKFTLFGTQGESQELTLDKEDERFERNSVDILRIDVDDVGKLTKLRISHNGKGSRPHWYLEKIVILNLTDESITIFECQHWLSAKEEDGKLVRELAAHIEGEKAIQETKYTVSVVTGDLRSCGTDANVYLIMFGETGNSGELPLKESTTNKDKFERGKTDVFDFTMLSLGKLSKIRIWHDNKYMRAGWFLSHVDILDNDTKLTYNFPCERWLAKDEDDGSLIRELPCANKDKDGVKRNKKKSSKSNIAGYELTFTTSDKANAGTIHNITVMFIDVDGKMSDEILIENSSKKKILRRGQTDVTKVVCKPLSQIQHVQIEMKPKKAVDEPLKWHLNELIVNDLEDNAIYKFPYDKWIRYNPSSDDNSVRLECVQAEKSRVNKIRELQAIQYIVKVFTADVSGAGTDANVSMTLYGENGDSGKRPLKKSLSHMDKFERAHMDDFKLEVLDLGKLTKVHIEHDNKGFGAGWMLDRVEVVNTVTSETYNFPCNQWFDKSKGDKAISRELHVV